MNLLLLQWTLHLTIKKLYNSRLEGTGQVDSIEGIYFKFRRMSTVFFLHSGDSISMQNECQGMQ